MNPHQNQYTTQDLEYDIANILKGLAYWEISIENLKLKLAENPNFDVHHVWQKLDKNNQGFVETKELQEFLAVNRIAASERETEMLINITSNQKGIVSFQSYFQQVLPQTNVELQHIALNRKAIQKVQQVQHFTSDIMVGSFSETMVANIYGEELKYYREIEQLRSDFARNYGLTTNQVFHIVDYKNSNSIDKTCIQNFFKKIGIVFGDDEYYALLQRTTNDNDEKLDYEELVNAIMPREPFDYPAFRQDFKQHNLKRYVMRKATEFQQTISPLSFGILPPQERPDPTDYYVSLRKVFNPYTNGRNSYFCDKGYMGQLKDYRDIYYQPNKDYNYHYESQGKKGIRYHDSYFNDFYQYIHDRDQNEQFFNKFGKRYQLDDMQVQKYQIERAEREKLKLSTHNTTLKMSPIQNTNNYNQTINKLRQKEDTFL